MPHNVEYVNRDFFMVSTFVIGMSSPMPAKGREQDAVDLDKRRPEQNQQQRREDAEDEWE